MIFSEEELVIDSEMIVETEVVEVTSETLYCVCKQPWDKNNKKFMIQCDCCKEWFHGDCVELAEYLSKDIDKYHCFKCEVSFGPSILKTTTTDEDVVEKYKQPGTQIFIEELKTRVFHSMDKVVKTMRGGSLTMPELLKKGFSHPILVNEIDGLGIKLPEDTFSVADVMVHVGEDKVVDVIDVRLQKDFQMTMKQFAYYFTKPGRTKPYNLISLEFSETNMSKLIEPPYIARKLDWVCTSWPKSYSEIATKPEVSKYCLISPEGSYTDFHVDFGGTSVWYHVLWGEKIFYLFEPTQENLACYNRWMSQTDRSAATFLGDLINDKCYECTLKKGQTLFIPTGWIHAVLTPKDSLVFGGNFLHFLNMDLQLQIYAMEKNLKIPPKYAFPSFEATHWFAAEPLIEDVESILQSNGRLPAYLMRGLRVLHDTLKVWSLDKESLKTRRESIPRCVNVPRILKSLAKLLKLVEKFDTSKSQDDDKDCVKMALKDPKNKRGSSEDGSPSPKKQKAIKDSKDPLKMIISRVSSTKEVKFSPSSSPSHVQQNPLKLKFKKQSSLPGSSNSSPSHHLNTHFVESIHEQPKLEIDVGYTLDGRSKSLSPLSHSPPIKIRFNVSESKAELIDSNSNTGSDVLHIVESDKDELQIDTDQSTNSLNVRGHSRSKGSKGRRKHHRKSKCRKKQSAERTRNMTIDDELAGTLSGIDELMKSSNYTERIQNCTSLKPQMKTAIKDMLEIQDEILPLKKRQGHKKKKLKNEASPNFDIDYGMDKVHQDDDYIYLPLAGGSDDEGQTSKKGKKRGRPRETDIPWSPRIKVGKVSARDQRPARDKARRKAVEKGLERAAEKLSEKVFESSSSKVSEKSKTIKKGTIAPKLSSKQKKTKSSVAPIVEANTSNFMKPQLQATVAGSTKKPKKGFATPKQRLGKILGIKFSKC